MVLTGEGATTSSVASLVSPARPNRSRTGSIAGSKAGNWKESKVGQEVGEEVEEKLDSKKREKWG